MSATTRHVIIGISVLCRPSGAGETDDLLPERRGMTLGAIRRPAPDADVQSAHASFSALEAELGQAVRPHAVEGFLLAREREKVLRHLACTFRWPDTVNEPAVDRMDRDPVHPGTANEVGS